MSVSPSRSIQDELSELAPGIPALAARGVVRQFRKGQYLIVEGDLDDSIFIIVRGQVRVFSMGESGREVTYGTYGPGEYVGEMSLDGLPRSANVVATESVASVQITRATLLNHLRECPEFAFDLLAKVIRRARAATLSARELALNDAYGRLVMLLNRESVAQPDGTRLIATKMTHQDIAGNLGCSREMAGRLLRDLERGRYISRTAHGMVLHRPLPSRW
jgi:CRP/FNR family cyclic AMP-dependent transcriptional regulator